MKDRKAQGRTQYIRDGAPRGLDARLVRFELIRETIINAQSRGVERAALLAALPFRLIDDEPVSPEHLGSLWDCISQALGDEFMGLGARSMPPGSLKMLCYSALHPGTLADAVPRILEGLHILLGRPRARLVVTDGLAEIIFEGDESDETWPPLFTCHIYWMIVGGLISWLAGRRIPLRSAEFRNAPARGGTDYQLLLRTPVRYRAERSCYAFNATYLGLEIVRDEAGLEDFLMGLPASLLVRHWGKETIATVIRERLESLPPRAWLKFEDIAEELALSPATLRRKLRLEGHSYQAIKDDLRRTAAIAALLYTTKSVETISADLGFAEPSAFHRAFRKWVSVTPGRFRRDSARSRASGDTLGS